MNRLYSADGANKFLKPILCKVKGLLLDHVGNGGAYGISEHAWSESIHFHRKMRNVLLRFITSIILGL